MGDNIFGLNVSSTLLYYLQILQTLFMALKQNGFFYAAMEMLTLLKFCLILDVVHLLLMILGQLHCIMLAGKCCVVGYTKTQ